MSDVGWGSDHLEPPKKRTIPLWVMGCAGGCMFAIGAAVVAAYFGGTMFKDWVAVQSKPEVQWPRLAEVLPFEERPAGFSIARWPVPVFDIWQLDKPSEDLVMYVVAAPEGGGNSMGKWLSSPKDTAMLGMQDGDFETVEGHLVLQGRELRSVRFKRTNLPEEWKEIPIPATAPDEPVAPVAPGEPSPPQQPEPPTQPDRSRPRSSTHDLPQALERMKAIRGDGLALDVTQESSDRRVLIWLVRGTQGETVSDEQAKEILAPFEIGPGR